MVSIAFGEFQSNLFVFNGNFGQFQVDIEIVGGNTFPSSNEFLVGLDLQNAFFANLGRIPEKQVESLE